jgi:iron complex outermembrane receptor protein
VENAAEATTRGVELEIQMLPIDGLFVTGSVGFLDAFYDSYRDSAINIPRPLALATSLPTTIDRSGDRFSGVPKWQTNLTAQYQLDYPCRTGWLEGSVTPRIEWIYESDIQYAGREVPSLFQPDVHRINARLTWRFNEDRSEVALWGKNLTDAYYFRNSIAGTVSTYGFAVRYYEPPRTYGIEVQHRF